MRDLVFVALTVGFFGLAAGVVRLCDRIVGPEPVLPRSIGLPDDRLEEVA